MKKVILSGLSILLVGTFCFADSIKDYKEIILNDKDQPILTELKRDLEETYKSKQLAEIVVVDKFLQTEQDPKELLWNNYPEFYGTEFQEQLIGVFSKDPNVKIKNFSFSGMEGTFTINTPLGKEEKLIIKIFKSDKYYTEISTLWNRNTQLLKEYRSLLLIHKNMLGKIRADIKNYSGKPYKGYISPKCTQEIRMIDLSSSKYLILCQPYSEYGKKPVGKIRYYSLKTDSSKLYIVNDNIKTALQNFSGQIEEAKSMLSWADSALTFYQYPSNGDDDMGPIWNEEASNGNLMILPKGTAALPKPDYLDAYGGYYCTNQIYKKIGLTGFLWKEAESSLIKKHVAKMPEGQGSCDNVLKNLSEPLVTHLSEIQ
jgi:hypothetical protein